MRAARLTVFVLAGLLAGWIAFDALRDWSFSDMEAYWNAAIRLRAGQALYQSSYSVGAHDLYIYSPWFAFLWVPLTFLPRIAVTAGWEIVLGVAAVVALYPIARQRTLPATSVTLILGSLLLWTVAKANVHALVVAILVVGLRTRYGPLCIAVAASLKAAPFAFVAVYIGRRQWWRVAATLAITAVLVAPVLLFDLAGYPDNPGISGSLWSLFHPLAWFVVAGLAFLTAIRMANGRFAWLGGAVAVIAAFPRLLDYDATFLLTASRNRASLDVSSVGPADMPVGD